MTAGRLTVEVAYALAREQAVVELEVEAGATVRQAIEASGILGRYPEIDPATLHAGVFGKLRGLDAPVSAGERIEIYRSLTADPREMRRLRASGKRRT